MKNSRFIKPFFQTNISTAAGVDEAGILGRKKREQAFRALRESDVAVVVVDGELVVGEKKERVRGKR